MLFKNYIYMQENYIRASRKWRLQIDDYLCMVGRMGWEGL